VTAGLASARCLNHPDRFAAGRCLECQRTFCRECVTEHSGRLTCANCLRKAEVQTTSRRNPLTMVAVALLGIAGFLGVWLMFYSSGLWLERITDPPATKASK
jgi:hypothetical protein